jgi:hypothetical protein
VPSQSNSSLVSHVDCPGGGQVWIDGTTLYIAHMAAPHGTTLVDVSDPRRPRQVATIDIPDGWHSHKVRVSNGIMLVNHEKIGQSGAADFGGGLGIYDVSQPSNPKPIAKWRTAGRGVHRYDFDGRYAYISPTAEGYVGNIMMILDLANPAKPVEVARWWIPGQWQAGGEPYPWGNGAAPRCHHPLRLGDRLYVSYWHHGLFILDISDMSRPKVVAHTKPVCRSRSRLRGVTSWWWRTRTWRSCGRRLRPSLGFTTSPSSGSRCRLPLFRCLASTATGAHSRR